MKPDLNKCIPGRTSTEYAKFYRDKIGAETLNQKTEVWRTKNKDKLEVYNKQRDSNNKDAELLRNREYHALKKHIVRCGCGGSYNEGLKSKTRRHLETNKHKKYVAGLL